MRYDKTEIETPSDVIGEILMAGTEKIRMNRGRIEGVADANRAVEETARAIQQQFGSDLIVKAFIELAQMRVIERATLRR